MKKLNGVLIGCGGIARRHLAALADLPHVNIAAVCDLSAARAEATAERFKVPKWYSNYDQMLAEVDPSLVHITTPAIVAFPYSQSLSYCGTKCLM